MTSRNSRSSEAAFNALAPQVRKWIWKQGWSSLKDIQIRAMPRLLAGGDLIISATTAGGKTEAAFLPLLSRVSARGASGSFDILYISPLKALINDQHHRLEPLCEALDLPITKWHGDVSSAVKQKALKSPGGVLLITPESLESLMMRRGILISRFFGRSIAVVIDELHAFMGTERGVQLRSLLNRLELLAGRKIDRVGLSATLSEPSMVTDYLRGGAGAKIPFIAEEKGTTNIRLQLRGYIEGDAVPDARTLIAGHVFEAMRGEKNLMFAGSKNNVEWYGATLRDLCEAGRIPNEFFTHHANISRADRESLERRLKNGRLPTTAVCTSTLELGIDIGDVEAVAQVGCSGSVSALRQRVGRSGRRAGKPAVLRAYNHSYELRENSGMMDSLRLHVVQAVAEIELLLEGVYEPPAANRLHFSTFVHQVMAAIVERGGASAETLYGVLCGTSPFDNITVDTFKNVLRAMARPGSDLIEAAPDGTLLLGPVGEKLTGHYKFYAVFETEEEFRLLHRGRELGAIPASNPIMEGMIIIFSGRRWRVLSVHADDRVIEVASAKGGTPPRFSGNGPARHKIIDEKMLEVFSSEKRHRYLDETAAGLLAEGRRNFRYHGLRDSFMFPEGDGVRIFPWAGSGMTNTLAFFFQHECRLVENEDYAFFAGGMSPEEAVQFIQGLALGRIPDKEAVAWSIKRKITGQYDRFLTDELLVQQLVSMMPDDEDIQRWARSCLIKGARAAD
ncbi:MAG: DEAD/DEAH box helicase [Alphaproteobacteria bacterium]|nr:DEAD/DEAH box helicase [Alphaproteobacteria bacterium]MDA8008707.1 DEAD/DEAH box helicase [Alphaproteobacteria bacterium]